MPLERILYPEWANEQYSSLYPFTDASTLRSTGPLALEPTTFRDASLYPIGAVGRVGILKGVITGSRVRLVIGDERSPELAHVEFDRSSPPSVLKLQDSYGRPAGLLLSEPAQMAVFQLWPAGEYEFDIGAAEFVASVVTPMPEVGLRGFILPSGELVTGDVLFVGGYGVLLSWNPPYLRVNIVGDPYYKRRLCSENAEQFVVPRFVKTINGVPPDEFGDFKLVVGNNNAYEQVLRILPDGSDGIRLEAAGLRIAGD